MLILRQVEGDGYQSDGSFHDDTHLNGKGPNTPLVKMNDHL
jgi:hypothetical protein